MVELLLLWLRKDDCIFNSVVFGQFDLNQFDQLLIRTALVAVYCSAGRGPIVNIVALSAHRQSSQTGGLWWTQSCMCDRFLPCSFHGSKGDRRRSGIGSTDPLQISAICSQRPVPLAHDDMKTTMNHRSRPAPPDTNNQHPTPPHALDRGHLVG